MFKIHQIGKKIKYGTRKWMNIYCVFLMLRGKNHILATIRQTDTLMHEVLHSKASQQASGRLSQQSVTKDRVFAMEFDKKYIIQNEHFNKIVYYTLYCAICSIFTVCKIERLDTTLESKKNQLVNWMRRDCLNL